jgi:4-alpha-glucanotransferase
MSSLSLVFAVHNHQPSGNFESVLEDAYCTSYLPFLQVLDRHPAIAFTQHWTGTLLEWLVRKHPECVELMRAMVQRGQLELLSGGYYEPILAVIPEPDRIGQINKLTELVSSVFDYTPRGAWLAERVWEPQLAGSLARAGMEFVVVDDTHFRYAGLMDEQLFGYYVTEELGEALRVFPIDKTLRYTVPFRSEMETLNYLKQTATEDGKRVVVHADDGEKFGVWPKTYKHVYEDGWLERFCHMIEVHEELIGTTHFGKVLDEDPPQGKIYLPTASYFEMTKWVLTPDVSLRLEGFEQLLKEQGSYEQQAMFVRGGFWRNFFAKYPESNHMHKKMLRVSRKVHEAFGDGSTDREAFEAMWAGQCNDPYWHGLFGGLYLPNLRFPVYRNLIAAEVAVDTAARTKSIGVKTVDFDCDGFDEVVVESPLIDLCFKPSLGGSLVELSYKPGTVNLLDVLSRREESSHRKLFEAMRTTKSGQGWDELLAKEKDLDKHIYFDWYRHASFLDHFFEGSCDLESFAHCRHKELGDFVNQPFGSTVSKTREHVVVELVREGAIWENSTPHRLRISKKITIHRNRAEILAEYEIANLENKPLETRFGVEFALGGMAGDAEDRYWTLAGLPSADQRIIHDPLSADNGSSIPLRSGRLRTQAEDADVLSFKATDEWMHVSSEWELSEPATLWRFPLETVSLSESGFERLYQGSVALPLWSLALAPKGNPQSVWNVTLKQRLLHWD